MFGKSKGAYKNFHRCCDELLGPKMQESTKLVLKVGGMSTLLLDYSKKETLTNFESQLLHHVMVKQPTKDELLLK
jgi:catechol-2,3-dioxygenase